MRTQAARGPQRARGSASGLLALGLLSSACSLQGLDDLTPPYAECAVDDDCEPLNARDGLAGVQCRRWECVQSYCRLRVPETPIRFDRVPVLDSPADLHEITPTDRGLLATFLPAMGGAATMFRATARDASPVAALGSMIPDAHQCGDLRDRPCSITDVSTAWLDGDLHVVAAHVLHPDAPVWIGTVTATAPDVAVPGPAARSSIWDGVTPSPDGTVGALSVATSPFDLDRTPQALAVMVVSGSTLGVQALGLWVERDADGNRWAHGTSADSMDPGTPDLLGPPPRDGALRPGVVGLGRASSGWLVAYPASPSGLALVRVAELPDPASCAGSSPPCVTLDGEGNLITRIAASGERTSAPLTLSEQVLAVGEISGDVVLAAATQDPMGTPTSFEVALAYRRDDEIVVALATVDGEDVTVDLGAARRVAAPGVRDVSLARLEDGLGTGDRPGGYLLAWSTSENTYLARLPDGREPSSWALEQVMTQPHAFMSPAGVLHVVGGDGVEGADGLVVLPRVCDPGP